MHPHQERVVQEKSDLDEKIAKLAEFIGSEKYSSLSETERDDLRVQIQIMGMYSGVLASRIEMFA